MLIGPCALTTFGAATVAAAVMAAPPRNLRREVFSPRGDFPLVMIFPPEMRALMARLSNVQIIIQISEHVKLGFSLGLSSGKANMPLNAAAAYCSRVTGHDFRADPSCSVEASGIAVSVLRDHAGP